MPRPRPSPRCQLSHRFPRYRNFCFVIKLSDLSSDSMIHREAMQAGGELLEYFNVARARFRGLDDAKPTFERMPKGRLAA